MDNNFRQVNLNGQRNSFNLDQRGGARKKDFLKRFKLILFIAAILIISTVIWSFLTSSSSTGFRLSLPGTSHIKSTDGRVNVLLLGNGGGTHAGAALTDSIIVASYHLKSKKVTFISIPRDLWLDGIDGKVNAAYEIGAAKGGNGLKFSEDKIDDILGIPVHYGVRLDFDGFAKAVNLVEGVDVDVPNTFDDYNYPITGKEEDLCGLQEKEMELTDAEALAAKLISGTVSPAPSGADAPKKKYKVLVDANNKIASDSADFACRYEHIHFEQGVTHMDGETALKFVRSRMGTNGEGSDFARSRRQQRVIEAFRNKALSLQTLFNPQKIVGLIGTFGESFETDVEKENYLEFYNMMKSENGVDSIVLGDLGGGKSVFTVGAVSKYGAYVLVPPEGDFSKVKEYVMQKLIEDDSVQVASPSPQAKK